MGMGVVLIMAMVREVRMATTDISGLLAVVPRAVLLSTVHVSSP